MRAFSKYLSAALLGTVILSSCSRPVAYFQPTAREQFKSTPTEAVAIVSPTKAAEATVVESSVLDVIPAPAEQLNQTKQAVSQVEAYVRNDSKLASNKKLSKRMARLNELLTTSPKASLAPTATSTQKTTLMQRMLLKKMDKKIKNHVAPNETKVMDSNVRLGIIVGIVGLLLLILGNGGILAVLGGIGLVVGLVLILLGVINT